MFRAEVVGSMLRPSYLKEARSALDAGQMSVPEFKRIEDRAVDQVIATQEGSRSLLWPSTSRRCCHGRDEWPAERWWANIANASG